MRTPRLGVATLAALGALALTGCGPDEPGDRHAWERAQQVLDAIADEIDPPRPVPRPADDLAALAIAGRDSSGSAERISVQALDWSGDSGDEAGATIELRISMHTEPVQQGGWNGTIPAGDATRCWRLTFWGFRTYDTLRVEELACPDGQAARIPDPRPRAGLPDDVERLIVEALTGATGDDAIDRLRERFPDDRIEIGLGAFEDGRLVAAVGIPLERECAVGSQQPDGTVQVSQGFGVRLEPGEQGCSPELLLHPVVTH